jgi:hypothetical protein
MSYTGSRAFRGLIILGALAIATALALPASPARADLINLSACSPSALGQPFAPWGDLASYELAPGGDFETSAWALYGGAHRVHGSEPYAATGTLGGWSLSLPMFSSAQSPPTCVDAAYPTVRFFIGGTGAVALSLVDGPLVIPAGVALAGDTWQPSPVMLTTSPVVALLSGGTAQVSVRMTAVLGDPKVDDVFIDPWNRG